MRISIVARMKEGSILLIMNTPFYVCHAQPFYANVRTLPMFFSLEEYAGRIYYSTTNQLGLVSSARTFSMV